MELWDIYDYNRKKTGQTIMRGKKLQLGQYHLVIHAWIINNNGEILIQQRAPKVEVWPNMWAMTGGSAIEGEESIETCQREVYEELGISIENDKIELAFTIKRKDNFCDVWIIKKDFDIEQCNLQKEEVSKVMWAKKDSIKKLINEGRFVNYNYIDKLFAYANI